MKERTLPAIWLASLVFVTAVVHGQGHHKHGRPAMTSAPIPVSEARNLPKDSWVVVSGTIVNALPGGKYYMFRDSSGEITVEIEPKVWRGLSVGPSDKVVIGGEIEVKKGQVSIEAKTISGAGRMSSRHGQPVTCTRPITVNEARNLPHDSWVIITGTIVSPLEKEHYTFRDPSGEITVEIEKEAWRGLSVNVSDRVELCGELKAGKGPYPVKIKVKAIRKL